MELKLTETNVRTMAERLRTALGKDSLRQAKSLEVLAKMFGHKNWDTFIGLLRRPNVPESTGPTVKWTVPSFEPVTLYVGAFATTMHGDSPDWAQMTLTPAWLEDAREKVLLCMEHELDHVAVSHFINWYDPADEYRMGVADLYITTSEFWYRATAKHDDGATETRSLSFEMLIGALTGNLADFDRRYIRRVRDIVVFDTDGDPTSFLESLVDCGELEEGYLES